MQNLGVEKLLFYPDQIWQAPIKNLGGGCQGWVCFYNLLYTGPLPPLDSAILYSIRIDGSAQAPLPHRPGAPRGGGEAPPPWGPWGPWGTNTHYSFEGHPELTERKDQRALWGLRAGGVRPVHLCEIPGGPVEQHIRGEDDARESEQGAFCAELYYGVAELRCDFEGSWCLQLSAHVPSEPAPLYEPALQSGGRVWGYGGRA
jgi:hypothetical protein